MINKLIINLLISIHAPVWGATNGKLFPLHVHRISIHAPVWGATAGARRHMR